MALVCNLDHSVANDLISQLEAFLKDFRDDVFALRVIVHMHDYIVQVSRVKDRAGRLHEGISVTPEEEKLSIIF